MSGFSIDVDAREVNAALSRLREHIGNLTPVMRSIGQTLVTGVDLGFRAQSDPWGGAWAPLAMSTLKRRRGTSAHVLRDTGRLVNSFSYRADARSVTVGTDVIYAAVHQFGAERGAFGRTRRGAPIPWGRIPPRPMLPIRGGQVDLPSDTAEAVVGIVHDFLSERRR